ncbi:MAG: hypothetical protein K2X32_04605 [Phycisphaerales bacterium]|nr:hypothetical protein [Phycisphaerales bacterium]
MTLGLRGEVDRAVARRDVSLRRATQAATISARWIGVSLITLIAVIYVVDRFIFQRGEFTMSLAPFVLGSLTPWVVRMGFYFFGARRRRWRHHDVRCFAVSILLFCMSAIIVCAFSLNLPPGALEVGAGYLIAQLAFVTWSNVMVLSLVYPWLLAARSRPRESAVGLLLGVILLNAVMSLGCLAIQVRSPGPKLMSTTPLLFWITIVVMTMPAWVRYAKPRREGVFARVSGALAERVGRSAG